MDFLGSLQKRASAVSMRSILALFAENTARTAAFSVSAAQLFFDFSKTNISDDDLAFLLGWANAAGVADAREAMLSGAKINETEARAVLHTALRADDAAIIKVDGQDVMPGLRATRARMSAFADAVRTGAVAGSGGSYTDVVNIGIGGSDLGPAMAYIALRPYQDGPRCHFVSNIDGAHLNDILQGLDPTRTLVIIASKTFTTIETMTNAESLRDWMAEYVVNPADNFVALSSATERCVAFGIQEQRVFGFEDWVGGRYSVWGPIGLSVMLAVGPERFAEFIAGARAMDQHFKTAPLAQNMPVLLALVGIWHHQGCGYGTRAVLPYEQRLARLPAYLQQLEMESNGKSVAMDGSALALAAGPVVWGEPGTNGQHAFYQLIHQGRDVVPCEFMLGAAGHEEALWRHHHLLSANCLAQSEALLRGRNIDQARQMMRIKGYEGAELERQACHRVFSGNRPSTTLLYPKLTPSVLGQIIALYEHRVFVEGVMLGINSFDQWGVELGKELATALGPVLAGDASAEDKDPSTQMLITTLNALTAP